MIPRYDANFTTKLKKRMNADELSNRIALQSFLYLNDTRRKCLLTVHSRYVRTLLQSYFNQREMLWNVSLKRQANVSYQLQFGEYEEMDWEGILSGEGTSRCRASCYCVRKGLTRKAAWAQVVNKWCVVAFHGNIFIH